MKKIYLVSLLLLLSVGYSLNATLVYYNGTYVDMIRYDRGNYSSLSYADNTPVNPDIFLNICGLNASYLNKKVELVYSSESGNITIPITSLPSQIYNISNSSCSFIDIDLSTFEALYPGNPFLKIDIDENNTQLLKLNQSLNGSYSLGIDIDDVEKKVYLSVQRIYDNENKEIVNATKNNLIISLVSNKTSIAEARASPKQVVPFSHMFETGDEVFVNGISSLKVKVVPPCTIINETGYYYILNSSLWNGNDTCLEIRNVNNIVIDFANHTIDGDGNKSFEEGRCGVIVRYAENITIKDLRVQQYRYGVCVYNSIGVKILGTSNQANLEGIFLENSTSRIAHLKISNNISEIKSHKNSIVHLDVVFFDSANFSVTAKDVVIKSVYDSPPDPEGLQNISQWINITSLGSSWAQYTGFTFPIPPPRHILPKYIYKYDGMKINGTWNGTWEALIPTYVDVAKKIVFSPVNITGFSIFAPFGEKIPPEPQPQPQPQPVPRPTPSTVVGEREKVVPPKLNLTLHVKEIVIQQGETKQIGFNLTNEGDNDVYNSMVIADVRKGWKTAGVHFNLIRGKETKIDKFYLTVYENEIPGTYFIPVKAVLENNNVTVDVEILKVIVVPRQRVAKLDILEVLPYLVIPEESKVPISILVKNTGDYDLNNITLKIEGAKDCIEKVEGSYSVKKNEKKSLTFMLYTKKAGTKCSGVYVLESDRGPVAIYPVIIKVRPKRFTEKIKLFPILYIIWTLLTGWMIYRKIKKMRELY